MNKEPPRKKRKPNKNDSQESDKSQNTKRAVKRVESANNPSLLPRVYYSFKIFAHFAEKVLPTTSSCQRPLRSCTRLVYFPLDL